MRRIGGAYPQIETERAGCPTDQVMVRMWCSEILGFALIACISLLLENHIVWLSHVFSRSMVFADWMRLGWALVYPSLSLV